MARLPINEPIDVTTTFAVVDKNAFFGLHSGIDFAVAYGRDVFAPADGTIWWAGVSSTGGNMIILFDGEYYHRLMHNSVMLVSTGSKVTEGQKIAEAGATGLAFGVHVHWDVATQMLDILRPSLFSKFVNPIDWINSKWKEEEVKIQNTDNWFARIKQMDQRVTGHDLTRAEFERNYVGNEAWGMYENISDRPEALATDHVRSVGDVAVRDNWENQIYTLQDQVKALQTQLQATTDKLNELANKGSVNDKLQAQVDQLTKDNATYVAERAEQERVGNLFTRWMGSVLSKLKG